MQRFHRACRALTRSAILALAAIFGTDATVHAQVARIESRGDSALAALQAGRWAEAIALYGPLAAANPHEGIYHYGLGFSYSRSNDCAHAVPSLETAVRLGSSGWATPMMWSHFILASCAALAGDTTRALDQLETAWRRFGFRNFSTVGSRFQSVIGTARYRAMAGIPPAPLTDRADRWRFDLDYLDRLVRQTHPAPFHHRPETAWAADVARIRGRIPTLTDDQVAPELMGLMASVGDGHTALLPPLQGDGAWQLLPIWPVYLSDGWYVGAAAPKYASLVGGQILGAGTVDIAVLDSLARAITASDNAWTGRWLGQVALQFAGLYQLAGAAGADGTVTLRVRKADGSEEQAILPAGPMTRDPQARWAPRDWPTMAGPVATAPRWLRYAETLATIEWLPGERVLYVAVNAIEDGDTQSFADLGRAVRDSILARKPVGVVVDLRMNNGGDGDLVPAFVRPLLAIEMLEQPGTFQVLTGPRTFSAAGFLLHSLEEYSGAERVGWPTGVKPVTYGTEVGFTLPMSGLRGSISARLEVLGLSSDDRRPFFQPREAVWPSGDELRRGLDPVLDRALARIRDNGRP